MSKAGAGHSFFFSVHNYDTNHKKQTNPRLVLAHGLAHGLTVPGGLLAVPVTQSQ